MHGYEVMKAVEARFHGFYKPSPGAIYPALAALRRDGCVSVGGDARRKTYRITREGKAYLRSRRAEFDSHIRAFESAVGPDRAALFRELRTTGRLLAANLHDVTPRQAKKLKAVVVEMRERIGKVLAE
jgi:DNA-binding PadR family transcriptional regulator